MGAHSRSRPSLEVKTDYAASDGYPKTAFRTHRSPLPSATPITPKPLPSPLHPSTPRYDASMRQHERAMVESLDVRGRQGSLGFDFDRPLSRPLSPVADQSMAARVVNMTMDSPVHSKTPVLPVTAPATPLQRSSSAQRRQTIVEETRSMLLSGMSPSQANNLGNVASRKLSVPGDVIQRQRRQSLMLLQTDMLQTWGHVYFGDPTKADVFVAPSAMRRLSGTDSVEGHSHSDRLVIRARVRPKGKERKPFIITRSFDLGELRATLPSPSTPVASSRRQSGASSSSPDTAISPRMANSPLVLSRASSVTASSPLAVRRGSHQQKGNSREVPIHLPYARYYLPALAALMLSGHVRTGDTIDLPMPHPEAWTQTVAYVYTGNGEPTEAMRQNILHLGGRA
ncbi:hypothetical protein VMCG_08410 [Cytospora schulzeri]|uniref:Uncharacterized protein n=1 Tax=Cytospora schulzeri TaxID=448051 RepID=A0A423VR62_9PEZI|nr:hypothetical protein VMCG_08410 [Valsa malicola]